MKVFIVGPTASGKSSLAMMIATKFNGEIVCADSQTIRRDLNIGTAKPSPKERELAKHHMLDAIDPYEKYNVALFAETANKAIDNIISRNKLPIVVGGTGLYIDALLYNFSFRPVKDRDYSREQLEGMTVMQLQDIIAEKKLQLPTNKSNPRHLIRTIESSGSVSLKTKMQEDAIIVGIAPNPDVLKKRIALRLDKMISDGLFDEVEAVINKWGMPTEKVDAIAYSMAIEFRKAPNDYDEEGFKERMLIADRQYAKRQMSWFKRNKNIHWFNSDSQAFEHIKEVLS